MKRSAVLGIALLGALGGLPAGAQQAGKTYRVAILTSQTRAYDGQLLKAFRRTLAGLGYHEGKNLEIDYRGAGQDIQQLPALALELVRTKPDAIVASAPPAITAAKRATRSVPIVMTDVSDPVGAGFVASLARPGGNITGGANMNDELEGKRVQLLKELIPRLRDVAVLRNPSNTGNLTEWRAAEGVARTLEIQTVAVDVCSADQIERAFKTIPHLHVDAIIVSGDGVMIGNASRIVQLVAAQRLPAIYVNNTFAAAGGIMSYGASDSAMWMQVATYVDRILKGANPADSPVEQPTTFALIVNLKTAHNLGITIPQSILLRATQVIK